MNNKSSYKTSQKELVLDYFKKKQTQHATAKLIYGDLKEKGVKIGLTTVYRHLEKMTEEGILVKSIVDENTPACYEYTGHHTHESCYHCKCTKCGKLIHLHCHEISSLEDHIYQNHHFHVDPGRTVFFGLCKECQKGVSR